MELETSNITFDKIKDRPWRFSRGSGCILTDFFKFKPDGTVGGHWHDNERYWEIDNGALLLLNNNRVTTARFDLVSFDKGKLLLHGKQTTTPEIDLCLKEQERIVNNATREALSNEINTLGWSIGEHTYGTPSFIEKGMSRLVIGKYCSIANGVEIAFGNHRTDTMTTYPFRALERYWQNVPTDVDDHSSKGDVVIGHDVWIGAGVFIGSGVTIGSGAVIGARSVIVKDVPPFAIVVGNPGRVVRYRFESVIVKELLDLEWWNLSDALVDSLLPLLMSGDARSFICELKRIRTFIDWL